MYNGELLDQISNHKMTIVDLKNFCKENRVSISWNFEPKEMIYRFLFAKLNSHLVLKKYISMSEMMEDESSVMKKLKNEIQKELIEKEG